MDPTFVPECTGAVVRCLAVQPDGKIVVGGWLSSLGGQPRANLGRLNADGTIDATFNPQTDGEVHAVAVQADGKILVGGTFVTIAGQTRRHIARLNTDGTVDSEFAPDADDNVYTIALQPDGKIVVGGYFSMLAAHAVSNLGRLKSDGTSDTSFNATANTTVHSIALQSDGKIVVGGRFVELNGSHADKIGRLNPDGSIDAGFHASLTGYYVYSLSVQGDGKIVAGGWFFMTDGQPGSHLCRLQTNGTTDQMYAGVDNAVYCVTPQPDGKLLVGGERSSGCGFMGRLNNPGETTQNLSFDQSGISWLRGGSCPEVWRTSFEACTNGSDWFALGAGSRIPGGWRLAEVSLPDNATVRARGFVASAFQGSSAWHLENSTGPLIITGQPASRTNNPGTPASFAVSAAGTAPPTYL